jgi:hypothetical protein
LTFAGDVPDELAILPGIGQVVREGQRVRLVVEGDVNPLLALLARHPVSEVLIAPPRLEDVFMSFYDTGASGAERNGREYDASALVESRRR